MWYFISVMDLTLLAISILKERHLKIWPKSIYHFLNEIQINIYF